MKLTNKTYIILLAPILILLIIVKSLKVFTQIFSLYHLNNVQIILYLFILYLFITIISFIAFFTLLKKMFLTIQKESLFSKILKRHGEHYINALHIIDVWFKQILKKKYNLKEVYATTFIPFLQENRFILNNLYIILYILPKIILLIAFFIDIFINKTFYYFYFATSLLLIGLLFDYIIYTLKIEYERAIDDIESLIKIRSVYTHIIINDAPIKMRDFIQQIVVLKKPSESYKIELSDYFFSTVEEEDPSNIDREVIIKLFYKYLFNILDMFFILYSFEQQRKRLQPLFMIMFTLCLCIGWFTILLYNKEAIILLFTRGKI